MRLNKTLKNIIILAVLVILADYYYLHILFPIKKAAIMAEINQEVEKSLKENPPADNTVQNSSPTQQDTLKDFSITKPFADCFPHEKIQVSTANNLSDDLEKSWGPSEQQIEIENYHFQLEDNSEKRIQLLYADNSNLDKKLELRLFKVDKSGIPERVNLKPDETFYPKKEFIESLMKDGVLKFHQLKKHQFFKNSFKLFTEVQNKNVFEFQLIGAKHSLNCRQGTCECR